MKNVLEWQYSCTTVYLEALQAVSCNSRGAGRWALDTDRVDCIDMSPNLEHVFDHMVLIVDGGPVHRCPIVILVARSSAPAWAC